MTVTIPRAEIHAIAARHSVSYGLLDRDPRAGSVRGWAKGLRLDAANSADPAAEAMRAEADDLDALVDRVEREAA